MYIRGKFVDRMTTGNRAARGVAHRSEAATGKTGMAWLAWLICVLLITAPATLDAAPGSALVAGEHSSARLFAGASGDGHWRAGLEIALMQDWKTYWRVPGESGVAPSFDWSASGNLGSVSVGWPVPHRFSDAAGETIGYKDRIVFPLHVQPLVAGTPVKLALKLFYAACNNICIPAEANLAIELVPGSHGDIADLALIENFTGQLPGQPKPGARPSVRRLSVDSVGGSAQLKVSMDGELDALATDIFVEGYDRAYFRKPRPADKQPLTSAFLLPIDGLRSIDELRGHTLTVTVVSGVTRLEQRLPVN